VDKRAVFLDRDGTIARDVPYCRSPDDFECLPTVPEAIKLFNDNGFKVVVITNQSGIARGYFTEETLAQIHIKMKEELAKHGAYVDAIYCCPHHPDEGCDCRKPKTALFLQAAKDLDIELKHSFMVGDMQMDIDAGKAVGCKMVLVTTGPNGGKGIVNAPDYTAHSLLDVSKWILKKVQNTIIIPAWREEKGLPIVLTKLLKVVDDSYEIIVVDDGSDDATAQVASQFPCQVIRHEVNKGKGEALKTGIAHARGENIIWIDADDSYPAELIPEMVASFYNYDMVICSRKYGKENIPRFNRIGNFLFRQMIKRIYGFKPHDPCSGLYGAKKQYLDMMRISAHRFAIEPEISIKGSRMKLKMLDIPIEYRARVGDSKLNAVKVGIEDLWTILKLVPWRAGQNVNGSR